MWLNIKFSAGILFLHCSNINNDNIFSLILLQNSQYLSPHHFKDYKFQLFSELLHSQTHKVHWLVLVNQTFYWKTDQTTKHSNKKWSHFARVLQSLLVVKVLCFLFFPNKKYISIKYLFIVNWKIMFNKWNKKNFFYTTNT